MTNADDGEVNYLHTWAVIQHTPTGGAHQNPVGVCRDRTQAMREAGKALHDSDDALFAQVCMIPIGITFEVDYPPAVAVWVGVIDPEVKALMWVRYDR